jgi:hypothetical protein
VEHVISASGESCQCRPPIPAAAADTYGFEIQAQILLVSMILVIKSMTQTGEAVPNAALMSNMALAPCA